MYEKFRKKTKKVKFVIAKERKNVTMRLKLNYQTNDRYIMRKIKIKYYNNKTIVIYIFKN